MPLTKQKNIKSWLAIASIFSWLLLVMLVLSEHIFTIYKYDLVIPMPLKALLLNAFVGCTYFYLENREKNRETGNDFFSAVWEVFMTATICSFLSFILTVFIAKLNAQPSTWHILMMNLLYQIELATFFFFLLTALVKWKRLIVYQNNSFASEIWFFFEIFMSAALLSHFVIHQSFYFLILQVSLWFFLIISIFLSIQQSWIAYLRIRQKLASIAMLVVIVAALYYFNGFLGEYGNMRPISTHLYLSTSIFIAACMIFIGVYSLAAILVLFFSLPTSTVFEKKFAEISDLQQLTGVEDEDKLYSNMLDIAVNTLRADAAWLEVIKNNRLIHKKISVEEMQTLRSLIAKSGYSYKDGNKKFALRNAPFAGNELSFKSLHLVPLISKGKHLANLVLARSGSILDNVLDTLVNTYAAQASLALDNFRLIAEAVESERYKTEALTARKMRENLLNPINFNNEKIEIFADALSREEVGGDFYDMYKINDQKYALVIGDVSGKGTSAAYNMAQMKGIFHSLTQLELHPNEFLNLANSALSRCLEKKSFITLTFMLVDLANNKMLMSRAGHCPAIFIGKDDQNAQTIEGKGLGLGIVRNATFAKFTETIEIDCKQGDLWLLYTDGVADTPSADASEDFGHDRLIHFTEQNAKSMLPDIFSRLVTSLQSFNGQKPFKDDCTVMVIRFK